MDDSNRHIEQHRETEQRVLPFAHHQQHGKGATDDSVENGNHVGANDVRDRATGVMAVNVHATIPNAVLDLGCGQTGGKVEAHASTLSVLPATRRKRRHRHER